MAPSTALARQLAGRPAAAGAGEEPCWRTPGCGRSGNKVFARQVGVVVLSCGGTPHRSNRRGRRGAPPMWDNGGKPLRLKFAPMRAACSPRQAVHYGRFADAANHKPGPGAAAQHLQKRSIPPRNAPRTVQLPGQPRAYPPTQDSSSAAVSADSSPKTRCMGRSRAAGGGAAVSSSHTTKNGNSAGKTLCRQSAVPRQSPGPRLPARPAQAPQTPALPLLQAPADFCRCSYCAPHCVYWTDKSCAGREQP